MEDKMYRPEVQGPKVPASAGIKKPVIAPKPPVGNRPQKPGAVNKPKPMPGNAKAEAVRNWLLGQKKGK